MGIAYRAVGPRMGPGELQRVTFDAIRSVVTRPRRLRSR
jgi:hypothetical protein